MEVNSKTIKVDVEDNSPKVKEAFEDAIKKSLEDCGIKAQGYASAAAPIDTGRLAASITYNWSGRGGFLHNYQASVSKESFTQEVGGVDEFDHSVYIGTNVEYAPYVEVGANGRTPWHYLKNSVANHVNEYKDIIQKVLKKG